MTSADERPDLPSVYQKPDPERAEQRVRDLQAAAERLRAQLRRDAELSQELEDIMSALSLARIDLDLHRAQRRKLDADFETRRARIVRGSDAAP